MKKFLFITTLVLVLTGCTGEFQRTHVEKNWEQNGCAGYTVTNVYENMSFVAYHFVRCGNDKVTTKYEEQQGKVKVERRVETIPIKE